MKKNSLSLFKEIEANRELMYKKLNSLNDDALLFTPNEQAWSILQICHHLIVSEELSLLYLNKKLQDKTNLLSAGLGSSVRSFLLNLTLRLPVHLPAPERVSKFPENLSLEGLKSRWLNVRKDLFSLLNNLPEELYNKLAYKHPSAGRLTLYQMLTFFDTHIKRHEEQIIRLIQAGGKPERRSH